MRIIAIRTEADHGSGPSRMIACFDAAVTDDVRMFDLTLRQRPDGTYAAYPPKNTRNCTSATFVPTLATRTTAAAVAAFLDTQTKE